MTPDEGLAFNRELLALREPSGRPVIEPGLAALLPDPFASKEQAQRFYHEDIPTVSAAAMSSEVRRLRAGIDGAYEDECHAPRWALDRLHRLGLALAAREAVA